MIGLILRNIKSCINNQYFFYLGDIVSCGYHDDEGNISEYPTEYIWAESKGKNPYSNPTVSLDYLNADDVFIFSNLEWKDYINNKQILQNENIEVPVDV